MTLAEKSLNFHANTWYLIVLHQITHGGCSFPSDISSFFELLQELRTFESILCVHSPTIYCYNLDLILQAYYIWYLIYISSHVGMTIIHYRRDLQSRSNKTEIKCILHYNTFLDLELCCFLEFALLTNHPFYNNKTLFHYSILFNFQEFVFTQQPQILKKGTVTPLFSHITLSCTGLGTFTLSFMSLSLM